MGGRLLERALIEVLNMSLTASVVILAVFAARLLLKRAPRVFSYALWAVVLFRLLCPVSFSAPQSLLGTLRNEAGGGGRMEYIPEDIGYQMNPEVQLPGQSVNENVDERIQASLPQGNPQGSVNPLQIFLYLAARVWILGIGILAFYSMVSLIRLRKRLKTAVRDEGRIWRFPWKGTPFVYGLFRPRIYLPDSLTEQEERYILLHEKIHIRRGDQVFRALAWAALILHWFNPLVWAAFHFSGKDMEMSCDEAVLKKLGNSVKKEYSASLLALASGHYGRGGMPLAFGEGSTGSRIRGILRYRRPGRLLAGAALALCVVLAVWLAANPAPDSSGNRNVYYGITERVETADGGERLVVRIPRLGDLEIPETEKIESTLEGRAEEIQDRPAYMEGSGNSLIQEGDLLRMVFPAGREISVRETNPAGFSEAAERIEITGQGLAMCYEGADLYRIAVPLELAEEAEPGDVLHIYYDANENAGQPGEAVEEELLASVPVLETDAENRGIWVELSTEQTELFLLSFDSGITCGLEKTDHTAESGSQEPQMLRAEAFDDGDLEGRWMVQAYSVSRSARCIDLYRMDGQTQEEAAGNPSLEFSADCMFMVNRKMDQQYYEETDFSGFADAVMDGAGSLDGPFKTLVCEFKEGVIVRADLLYELEAYGIRWEPMAGDSFFTDMQEITGLNGQQLLDAYYTLAGTEQMSIEGGGTADVEIYTGNIGDGDSGIVLFLDEDGFFFYSLGAHTARAGWNNIYLGELDGADFILTLHIEDRDTYGRYDYIVFEPIEHGIRQAAGSSFEWGSGNVVYNEEYFQEWAEQLNLYLENSHLLLSTQEGELRVERGSEADRYNYETLKP